MSFIRIWVHLIWSTKYREPLISPNLQYRIGIFLKKYASEKEIFLDTINGYNDHIHCLVSMSSTQTASGIVKLLKGASSRWINEQRFIDGSFNWQNEYCAISVSESNLIRVRQYIKNQKKHHQRISFNEEIHMLEELLNKNRP
jgi:putative transposase